jgi:hypothetical protein
MYIHFFFLFVLSFVCGDIAMGICPVRGILPKCVKGFIVSEVNSELEQVRGPNP